MKGTQQKVSGSKPSHGKGKKKLSAGSHAPSTVHHPKNAGGHLSGLGKPRRPSRSEEVFRLLMAIQEEAERLQALGSEPLFKKVQEQMSAIVENQEKEAGRLRLLMAILGGCAGFLGLLFSKPLAAIIAVSIEPIIGSLEHRVDLGLQLLSGFIVIVPALCWIFKKNWRQEVKIGAIVIVISACLLGSDVVSNQTISKCGAAVEVVGFLASAFLAHLLKKGVMRRRQRQAASEVDGRSTSGGGMERVAGHSGRSILSKARNPWGIGAILCAGRFRVRLAVRFH